MTVAGSFTTRAAVRGCRCPGASIAVPIDPQGARAEIAQIDAGLKSCTQARAERGYKAKQVDTEIAADKAPREITRAEFRVVFG